MSEGEPLGCPLATVKQPTTLSSSQTGLPGSSGHIPRGPGSAGLQDPAPPLPASSPSWSPLSSTCSPSPAPSDSHPLGARGPSLALDVISWALWETQGDRVPIGVHNPQPRSHRSLFPPTPPSSTPSTPPQTTWPPSASQARWPLADHWSCLPPSPGEVFCFTQGAVPTYIFLLKSICGPPQIISVQGMMQVPGHSLPSCPGILVTKTRLSLSKWHIWQVHVARFSTVCPVVYSSVFHQHDTVRNTPA